MTTGSSQGFDPRAFRDALGCFATGVTVVTTRDATGSAVGLTANSFSSVSLEPPLVLWSLARAAGSMTAFQQARHWAVHVLAEDQEALSRRFAARDADRFAGLDLDEGTRGTPLLRGCMARFECRTAFQYDGGDHVIFVGEVLDFERSASRPLVFVRGRYASALHAPAPPIAPPPTGRFADDSLGYLLGRSHFQFQRAVRKAPTALTDGERLVLSALVLRDGQTLRELEASIEEFLPAGLSAALLGLARRGYALQETASGDPARAATAGDGPHRADDPIYRLTAAGRDRGLEFFAAAQAHETRVVGRLGESTITALKSLLRLLVQPPA